MYWAIKLIDKHPAATQTSDLFEQVTGKPAKDNKRQKQEE
jgi:hypothetical protein